MRWMSTFGGAVVCTGMLAVGWPLFVEAEPGLEVPPVLKASDLAPESLLKGPQHHVVDEVPTDGLLTRFQIRSDFGAFEAAGPGMLEVRVGEIGGLAELEKMSKTGVFANAMAESAKRTGQSVKNVVTNPADTAKGMPQGVGRFFKRVERSAKTGMQKAQDDYEAGQAEGKSGTAQTADAAGAAGRAAANVLGYSDARRRLAKQVQVDPYTTNPVLAARLDELGQAAFVGELGMTLGTGAVPVLALVNHAAWFSNLVWEETPGDLTVMIEKKLAEMGVAKSDVDRFLRHPQYSLTLQVALVTGLDALSTASGRASVVPLALSVTSEEQARFVVGAVAILARHQKTVGPISKVFVAGLVLAKGKDGALIVPAPVDYAAWTALVANFVERPDLKASTRGIWLAGELSKRTKEEVVARGWTVHEHFLEDGQKTASRQ